MELILDIANFLQKTPDWVLLYVFPVLLLAAAVGFVFAPKRKWFYCPAALLIAAGFTIACAKDPLLSLLYLGVLLVLCALLSLLFLIPCPKYGAGKVNKTRLDAMYEKFREELSEKPYAPRSAMPPKECCFEQDSEAGATAGEYGMSLTYVDSLLKKMFAKDLSAGDRLEAEELSRRIDSFRDKQLTSAERDTLNDCLASVLKLTAKYQL